MITATSIRSLCEKTALEEVEEILQEIERCVKANPSTARKFPCKGKFWVNEGYSQTPKWNQAKKILEDRGFKVEFYYQEFSIAVDMYTTISW